MTGVDISHYQEGLDVKFLPSDNYEFAILKLSEGRTIPDPCFDKFYSDCLKHNIPVGAYVLSHATTEAAAVAEVEYALSLLKGRPLDLGIFMDVETNGQMSCPKEQLDRTIRAFCKAVEDAGYRSGIYGSEYNLWRRVDPESFGDSFIWVARYGKEPDIPCDLWQHTNKGTVSYFNGDVDVDIARSARFKEVIIYESKPAPVIERKVDYKVAGLQLIMNKDGYWGEPDGFKSREFFRKIREYIDDMERC